MSKRVNIILADKTVAVLGRIATNRSRFIDRAVWHLIDTESKANLRALLKEEAIDNAARDLSIAAEWFPLEEEAVPVKQKGRGRQPARKRA